MSSISTSIVLLSDFSIGNLAACLENAPDTLKVQARVAPYGQVIPRMLDVADAFKCWSSHALRLLVDGDVKGALRNRKTHWYYVRNGPAIGRGKMPDALRRQEPAFVV